MTPSGVHHTASLTDVYTTAGDDLSVRWWHLPHLLSLDAPAVAVLWQEMLARAAGGALLLPGRLSLWCVVWAVYLADHLLDTRSRPDGEETARHRFARRHRTGLSLLLVLVVTLGALAVTTIRPALILVGLI